jgi:hypothetical protein
MQNYKEKGKVERTKLRWLDDVQEGLRILGIKRGQRKAQDRSEEMIVNWKAEVKLRGTQRHRRRRRKS